MKKIFLILSLFFCAAVMFAEDEKESRITAKFPAELIKNTKKKVETTSVLDGKTLLLYFASASSKPCAAFTPQLVRFYRSTGRRNNMEVIFISLDESNEDMMRFFRKMPWYAIIFDDPAIKKLKTDFKVSATPKLVVLDSSGKVIVDDGVKDIKKLGSKAADAWKTEASEADDCKKTEEKKSKKDKKSKKSKSSKKK